jgi:hypothetical protein
MPLVSSSPPEVIVPRSNAIRMQRHDAVLVLILPGMTTNLPPPSSDIKQNEPNHGGGHVMAAIRSAASA